jgi:hypothetical protein
MAGRIFFAAMVVVCTVVGFMAGRWRCLDRVAALPRYQLVKPLALQAVAGQVGSLPKGATLYEYRVLPEITTYIVFVNTKSRDLLSPSGEVSAVVHPIDAYAEDTTK